MKITDIVTEAANSAQQAAKAIAMKKAGKKPKQGVAEGLDNKVAKHNAAVAKLPGGQAHRSNHPDILHTAPKGYSFSVSHKLVPDEQGVAEGSEQKYLWHGSRQKIPMLEPRQSLDTGGAAGSNQNAIYATSDPKVAIAVGGLTTPDSDTAMFPNDPQMVLFSGKIRKGQNVYLHKLPFNGPDGKPQFVQGAHDREFYSIPGVKGIEPVEIKEVPVDKYLNLIRQATPADLELRKKNMTQGVAESKELAEEFDLIESIVEMIAEHNGVDAEAVWEDLESLTEDELYVFAVTSDPLMESEAWQKANKRDRTDGMSQKAVNTYRREHPGSKLKTAVTTKPSKLKKGSKASKRRSSYCSRSRGQMKMHSISCAKTPDKAICKARRRWNC